MAENNPWDPASTTNWYSPGNVLKTAVDWSPLGSAGFGGIPGDIRRIQNQRAREGRDTSWAGTMKDPIYWGRTARDIAPNLASVAGSLFGGGALMKGAQALKSGGVTGIAQSLGQKSFPQVIKSGVTGTLSALTPPAFAGMLNLNAQEANAKMFSPNAYAPTKPGVVGIEDAWKKARDDYAAGKITLAQVNAVRDQAIAANRELKAQTPYSGYYAQNITDTDPDVLWRQTVKDYEAGRISLEDLNKSRENLMGLYRDNKSRQEERDAAAYADVLKTLGIDAGSSSSRVSGAVSAAGREAQSARNMAVKAAKGDFKSMLRDIGQQVSGGTQDVMSGAAQLGMDVQPTIGIAQESIAEAGNVQANRARQQLADFIAGENLKVAQAKGSAGVAAQEAEAKRRTDLINALLLGGGDYAAIAKVLGGK